MEYLYSDEGQAGWLKGYCHTTRLDDLKARGVSATSSPSCRIPRGGLPDLDQAAAAKTLITEQWDAAVGADVK